MRRWYSILLLGGILLSLCGFRTASSSSSATLDLTVYQVGISNGSASITGLAVGSQVELYDNLGDELITTGTSDSNGTVRFPLDERFSLSALGYYHVVVKVDGISNGVVTCLLGSSCKQGVFSAIGLDGGKDDGILAIKVTTSINSDEPIENIQLSIWPANQEGVPIEPPVIGMNASTNEPILYEGVKCVTNAAGYCVAYVSDYFSFKKKDQDHPYAIATIKMGNITSYDGTGIELAEGQLTQIALAVDSKGRLDDCVMKKPQAGAVMNTSCVEKITQTATAQAAKPVSPEDRTAWNDLVIEANKLYLDTAARFAVHNVDPMRLQQWLESSTASGFDPTTQVKIVLFVNTITNDGYNAFIGDASIGTYVEITRLDDPESLLGVCRVNSLGECVTIVNRSELAPSKEMLQLRAIAGGFDNGILICKDEPLCVQYVYTVSGLSDKQDSIVLVKVVEGNDLLQPHTGKKLQTGKENRTNLFCFSSSVECLYDAIRRECVSDEQGACPLYIDDLEFLWNEVNGIPMGAVDITVSGTSENDSQGIQVLDNSLKVVFIAVDKKGGLDDCTFTSPASRRNANVICSRKSAALNTVVAGYTKTPTPTLTPIFTNTPLPSLTPTETEVPPTPTVTLTPTPQPGLFQAEGTSWAFPVGAAVIILLVGGGIYLILRRKRK